jgi:hypothetical protein
MMRWCWWMRRRVARHCLGDRSRAGARYRIHTRSGRVAAWLGPGRGAGAGVGCPASPVFLVACEPQVLGGDEGVMGLSPPVAAAITAVQALVRRLQTET